MSKTKKTLLKRLAEGVKLFYPELANHFLCPTCLAAIPLREAAKLSEAHIVPRSAKGGTLTILCSSCNTKFGAKQDKWMGEYLHLRRLGPGSILKARHKGGYLTIGGVRVAGTYADTPERGVEFFVWSNKSSPDSIRALDSVLAGKPRELDISVPTPLLQNRDLIEIGFLTAAYLLWFRSWTYSWALQEHLEPIRQQIQAPEAAILNRHKFVAALSSIVFETPTIGVGLLDEQACLFAGIADRLVLLPPASTPDLYARLPDSLADKRFRVVKELTAARPNAAWGPMILVFQGELLLAADVVHRKPESAKVYLITKDGKGPLPMFPISDAEFAEAKRSPNSVLLKSSPIAAPKTETGRPPA